MKLLYWIIVYGLLLVPVFTTEDIYTFNSSKYDPFFEDDDHPWCPPSSDIFPCTCDGPPNFLMLICDRIEDSYIITRVTRSVGNIRNFGKFSLTNSRLRSLETNVLGFLKFEYIYARKNTVNKIESVFFESSRDSLKRIEIIHNDVEKVPYKELSTFPKLEYISFKYNSIKSIPDEAFGKVMNDRLKKIDFSFNKINHIGSNAFKYLCNLEVLDLRFNKLTVLNNNAFAGFQLNPKLNLNLAENKVMFLSDGVFENQIFKCLNMSNNNLGKFPEKIFRNTLLRMGKEQNGIIYVYNNRFRCTCENMEWLVRLPTVYKSRVVGLQCINHDNKKIQELSLYDIGCRS